MRYVKFPQLADVLQQASMALRMSCFQDLPRAASLCSAVLSRAHLYLRYAWSCSILSGIAVMPCSKQSSWRTCACLCASRSVMWTRLPVAG